MPIENLTKWGVSKALSKQLCTEAGFFDWIRDHIANADNKMYVVAGENINGGNAVIVDTDGKVYKFDITDPLHANRFAGMAETSTTLGDTCTVTVMGVYTNVGSGYTPGVTYYVAANSMLTATPPVVGTVHAVGVGVATDKVVINNNLEFELI